MMFFANLLSTSNSRQEKKKIDGFDYIMNIDWLNNGILQRIDQKFRFEMVLQLTIGKQKPNTITSVIRINTINIYTDVDVRVCVFDTCTKLKCEKNINDDEGIFKWK